MSTAARDALDDKVNQVFAGKCVRKDLVRAVKVGANVPVFVLEHLLGKYCASFDPAAISMPSPKLRSHRNSSKSSSATSDALMRVAFYRRCTSGFARIR